MAKSKKHPTETDLNLIENPQASECDYCGITYADFPTGETYESVYETLWKDSDDPSEWLNKGRHTVLGRWHEIKQSMWRDHLAQCEEMEDEEGQEEDDYEDDFDEY